MLECSYENAIRSTLADEMRANAKVLLLGADADGADALLAREFGHDRVQTAPLDAITLIRLGIGAAISGYKPVVALSNLEALTRAASSLINDAASRSYRSIGKVSVPLVVCVACHGPSPEAFFAHVPGLLLAAPATPYDAKGLLRTTLRLEENPVLFLEYPQLDDIKDDVPEPDYTVPFGQAALRRSGKDVTVVTYGRLIHVALAACQQVAAEHRIEADLLDLRTLKPFDLPAILESLRKTGRVLLCSDAACTGNFVCELAMRIQEHGFDDLDAPIRRVCAADVPLIASATQAIQNLPSQSQLAQAIQELVNA
ncbi:MAG: transketolase C-terminal domain-containing protein [Planctomycetota bacterium]